MSIHPTNPSNKQGTWSVHSYNPMAWEVYRLYMSMPVRPQMARRYLKLAFFSQGRQLGGKWHAKCIGYT